MIALVCVCVCVRSSWLLWSSLRSSRVAVVLIARSIPPAHPDHLRGRGVLGMKFRLLKSAVGGRETSIPIEEAGQLFKRVCHGWDFWFDFLDGSV